MFKKSFESMFIIDANEKPAPSFFAAYILTWLVVHNQVFTSFFKSVKGTDITLYDRMNAALLSVPPEEHHWFLVVVLTFVVVFARFIFNSLIYMFREGIENKSQGWLKEHDLKSPVSALVHQQTLDALAKLKADSHSLYDRTKKAEKDETDAINKLDEFQESSQAEYYTIQQSLEDESTKNDELNANIKELTENLDTVNEKFRKSSSAHEQLKIDHNSLLEERNNLNTELNESSKIQMDLQNKHRSLVFDFDELTNNYNNTENKLINANKESANLTGQVKIMDQSMIKLLAQNEELASDLSSSDNLNDIIHKRITKWADKTEQPELMLLGRDESKLNNGEKILLDKLLSSLILKKKPLKRVQGLVEKVKLAGLADVDAASRAKKINEDFKLAGLGDVNAISQAKKITEEIKLAGLGDVNAISQAKKIIEDINLAGLGDENLAARIKKITEDVNLTGLADANAISSEKDN
jgi:hypothetical protein